MIIPQLKIRLNKIKIGRRKMQTFENTSLCLHIVSAIVILEMA